MGELASNSGRDLVAEGLASFFGWVADSLPELSIAVGVVLMVVLIGSVFGSHKICWWCKGKGYRKRIVGVNPCSHCGGKGIRPRARSGG